MVEFTDQVSVAAWCETRTLEEIAIFAALNAASIFPDLARVDGWAIINSDIRDCRAILATFVRGLYSSNEFDFAASAAFQADPLTALSKSAVVAAFCAASRTSISAASHGASSAATAAAVKTGTIGLGKYFLASGIASQIELRGAEDVMRGPLWNGDVPKSLQNYWAAIQTERSKDAKTWGFWIDWYQGLLEGRRPDRAMWREVTLIDDAIWQMGPEAVAEAIEEIKRKLAPPILLPEVVTAQARRLLAQPKSTKLIANDAADQLEAAIAAHLAVANGLPDELKRLHTLPTLLRNMAVSSQSAEHIAELEAQIVQLVGETLGLSRDVQGLRFELSQQKGPTGWAVYREQAIKTSAILSVGGAATTVVAALSYLTGITGIETAVERFGDFAAWIVEETPQLEKAVEQFQAAQNTPIDV